MKTIKTYGVYGMVEKTIILNYKGSEVKVTFTGGSANTNGIIPARFTTDNPVFQYIIEHSKLFELKNIKLVRSVSVKDTADVNDKKPRQVNAGGSKPKDAMEKVAQQAAQQAARKSAEADAGSSTEAARTVVDGEDGMKEVMVTDIQSDGRQYLIKECGVKAHELRTRPQVEKAAAEMGIRFVVK